MEIINQLKEEIIFPQPNLYINNFWNLKVIDFERKGNVIRFYLGDNNCDDYWGDDWDDIPYEHNAGKVDTEYIKGTYDLFVPFNYTVLEPCDGQLNSDYSKEDMKEERVPCIIITNSPDAYLGDFNYFLGDRNTIKIYFNTLVSDLPTLKDSAE